MNSAVSSTGCPRHEPGHSPSSQPCSHKRRETPCYTALNSWLSLWVELDVRVTTATWASSTWASRTSVFGPLNLIPGSVRPSLVAAVSPTPRPHNTWSAIRPPIFESRSFDFQSTVGTGELFEHKQLATVAAKSMVGSRLFNAGKNARK